MNLIVLRSIYRAFVRVRRGEPFVEEEFDMLLGNRGFLSKLFRPMFRLIAHSWHMYPLDVLFGLGFDTAIEIGVPESRRYKPRTSRFGRSCCSQYSSSAGMSLIDTTDNTLMLGAYGWAFVKPIRHLSRSLSLCLSAGLKHLGCWLVTSISEDGFGMAQRTICDELGCFDSCL